MELPTEGELQSIVNAALSGLFQELQRCIAAAIPPEVRRRMDPLLLVPESGVTSGLEALKAKPGIATENDLSDRKSYFGR